MNNTKTITLALKKLAVGALLLLPLALPLASQAKPGDKDGKDGQKRGGRGGREAGMMKRATRELGLSEVQKSRLSVVMKETEAKRRSIRANAALSPEQKRAQMRATRTGSMARMNAILTPAQRAKVQAMIKRSMEERRASGQAR